MTNESIGMLDKTEPRLRDRARYEGAEWIQRHMDRLQKGQMSNFGRIVGDLLGDWLRGIYHADRMVFRTDWTDSHYVEITLNQPSCISTWDFDELTRLVILCHDRCIRCEVSAAAPGLLRIMFHPREGRVGMISKRHPTIEEAI